MARVFIIPQRNDLAGINLSLTDVQPNAGQKNSIYDGAAQNIYIAESIDPIGATVVNGLSWVSGSLNTQLAADAVADDTTGGGNDVTAVADTTFGLAAYLKDRVQAGGVALATAPQLAFADANTIAQNLMTDVVTGVDLDLARINTRIAAVAADSDLNGASGFSRSFGTVEEVLRILAGESYRLRALTIIENVAGEFLTLAQRTVFVDAQTPAEIATQGQFYAAGAFLTASDAGYRARPTLIRNGSINASAVEGVLAGYAANPGIEVLNRNFAYTAGAVTTIRPRAVRLDGTAVPTNGISPAVRVITDEGVVLA